MILSPVKEIDVYGVFVPPLLMWGTFALLAVKVGHMYLARKNFYRSDTEAQIFDASLFIILTSLLSLFVH
jgi:hypothetical protein